MSSFTFGKHAALVAATTAALLCATGAHAQALGINAFACGPIAPPGQFGPFDYRTAPSEVRHKVEDFHFTPTVEQAIDGATGTYGGDIDYTLRAFPNNPRALLSISKYSMKRHTERIGGAKYATECYFERAVRFQPNDPMVRLVYAIYLRDRKRTAELRTQLDEAERARGDQSNYDLDYNLGLMYFEIGDLDKATVAAKRAYALGAPLPALASKLKAKGRSVQAPPAAAAAATAPTSTPASPTAAATAPEVSLVPSAPPAVSAAPTAAPPTAQ